MIKIAPKLYKFAMGTTALRGALVKLFGLFEGGYINYPGLIGKAWVQREAIPKQPRRNRS